MPPTKLKPCPTASGKEACNGVLRSDAKKLKDLQSQLKRVQDKRKKVDAKVVEVLAKHEAHNKAFLEYATQSMSMAYLEAMMLAANPGP